MRKVETSRKFRINNPDYNKDWRERNPAKNKDYYQTTAYKQYKQDYYQKNKERVDEKHNEYYQKNKERMNEKHNCECGGKYTTCNISTHLKTKKHCEYIRTKHMCA